MVAHAHLCCQLVMKLDYSHGQFFAAFYLRNWPPTSKLSSGGILEGSGSEAHHHHPRLNALGVPNSPMACLTVPK
jgi:hypothetical protein